MTTHRTEHHEFEKGDEVRMPRQPSRRRFGTVQSIDRDGVLHISVRDSFSTVLALPQDVEWTGRRPFES